MNTMIPSVSVLGALLILLAFLSLQRGWWASHGSLYLWANFIGSVLLGIVAVYDRRFGFIMLEAAWAAVSLWSILKPLRTGHRPA